MKFEKMQEFDRRIEHMRDRVRQILHESGEKPVHPNDLRKIILSEQGRARGGFDVTDSEVLARALQQLQFNRAEVVRDRFGYRLARFRSPTYSPSEYEAEEEE